MILILLAVLVLGLVVIFGLFRVRKLVISGNKQYKAEEIQEAIMQDGLCKNSLYLLWKFSDQAKVKESKRKTADRISPESGKLYLFR